MATKPKAPPGQRVLQKLAASGAIVRGNAGTLKPSSIAEIHNRAAIARGRQNDSSAKATRVRMAPDVRKGQLDAIVLDIFRTKNYMSLTRRAVAEVAEVSESLPTNYYGTAAGMRKEALRMACAACTPADVKAVQRALETGDIKRADVSKKMLQALK